MAYPPQVSFVTSQPKQYDIRSNFTMFSGERLLYHGDMKTGCCELGDIYYTSVTDTRYIERNEQYICWDCFDERPHIETCIYLRDIGGHLLRTSGQKSLFSTFTHPLSGFD